MHLFSKMGPDIVDVIEVTWLNVAIPAILHGCEMIPFSEANIVEIERIQSQVAKYALGIPISSSNFSAQTELGFKSFRHQLYDRQLKYYFRVLYLPRTRWVHQALLEHLSGNWESPYVRYISSLRTSIGIVKAPTNPRRVKTMIYEHFLSVVNSAISHIAWMEPLTSFSRQWYVSEHGYSPVITGFRIGCEGLGNKQPRSGRERKPLCPVCPQVADNNGFHLLFACTSISRKRAETGITSFITSCSLKGFSMQETYAVFINGFDYSKRRLSYADYIERGKCMNDMKQEWLQRW